MPCLIVSAVALLQLLEEKGTKGQTAEGNLRRKPGLAIVGSGLTKENAPEGMPVLGHKPTPLTRKEQVEKVEEKADKVAPLAPLERKVKARIVGALPLSPSFLRKGKLEAFPHQEKQTPSLASSTLRENAVITTAPIGTLHLAVSTSKENA